MELQPVAQIIAERRSAIESYRVPVTPVRAPGKKSFERAGNALIGLSLVGFLVMLIGMIPLGLAHPVYMDSLVLWFIEGDLLLCLAGLGLKTLPRLLDPRTSRTAKPTTALLSEDQSSALSSIALPSVTEQTTKSLEPPVRGKLSHRNE